MSDAPSLVKPYWIRIGSGGLPIASDRELVALFFDEDPGFKRAFELIRANPYGNLRARNYYWNAEYIEHEIVGKGKGLVMIPGSWPEPKGGPIWQNMVPFKPEVTACDAGTTASWPQLNYVVREGEQPWDVAMRFGQPYDGWIKLRQANRDDPDGFIRPAKDSGPCTWASWKTGKLVRIPAEWHLPDEGSPVWNDIIGDATAQNCGVGEPLLADQRPASVQALRKDTTMQTRPYIIQRGDTPGTVAGAHGVTKEDLYAANPHLPVVTDRFGDREVYKGYWDQGHRINLPTSSGSVGATMRHIPQIRQPHYPLPSPFPLYAWDDKHPNWPGRFLSFWSTRLHETLRNLMKANSAYDIAPLARRVSEQPDIETKLNAWLRSWTGGPVHFIDDFWSTTPTSPTAWDVAVLGWMNANVVKVSKEAATRYLHYLCVGANGHPYNPYTGECSLSGDVLEPPIDSTGAWRSAAVGGGNLMGPSGTVGGCGCSAVGAPPRRGWAPAPGRGPSAQGEGSGGTLTISPGNAGCPGCGCSEVGVGLPVTRWGGGAVGGCSTYGMDQFAGLGGQVGWGPKLKIKTSTPAQSTSNNFSPPTITFNDWGMKHPQWNGTNEAYWSQRVTAAIKSLSHSAYDAHRADMRYLAALPQVDLDTAVLYYLRSFPNVQVFRSSVAPYPPPPLDGWWFADPSDPALAAGAAIRVPRPIRAGYDANSADMRYIRAGIMSGPQSGQVGATGDKVACPGGMIAREDVRYILQPDDYGPAYPAYKFGIPENRRGELTQANPTWPQCVKDSGGKAMISPWTAGTKLRVPLIWFGAQEEYWQPAAYGALRMKDPSTGEWTLPYVKNSMPSVNDCSAGQFKLNGQGPCLTMPPGTSLPTTTGCQTGTTNIGGICIPNLGYTPPVGQACLPGTTLSGGKCVPGTGTLPGNGVPPMTNGLCPTRMRLYSDNLCYFPGDQPSGVTPVSLTDKKADEGFPTWGYALIGVGAVAGVLGVAKLAQKRKEDKAEDEQVVEEERVVTAGSKRPSPKRPSPKRPSPKRPSPKKPTPQRRK
jgi:hypothetical protein